MAFDLARPLDEGRHVPVDPAGVASAAGKVLALEDCALKGQVGRDAGDSGLGEGTLCQPASAAEPAAVMHDDFGEKGVEARIERQPGVGRRIDAYARTSRRHKRAHAAAARHESAIRAGLLRVHPHLDRRAGRNGDGILRQADLGQRGAAGETQLGGDEVDSEDLFGDRVLDLQARVDLEEEELAGGRGEEFDGGHTTQPHGRREPHSGGQHVGPRGLGQDGARGDLDELLMAALHATVAIPQMGDGAGAVADDLNLDVAGID